MRIENRTVRFFHMTKEEHLDSILKQGLITVAGSKGMMGEGIYLLEIDNPDNQYNLPMLIIDFFEQNDEVLVVEGEYTGPFVYSDLPEEVDTLGYLFIENGYIPVENLSMVSKMNENQFRKKYLDPRTPQKNEQVQRILHELQRGDFADYYALSFITDRLNPQDIQQERVQQLVQHFDQHPYYSQMKGIFSEQILYQR